VLAAGISLAAQTPSLGRISFPTSGSAQAQAPFIRGVLLLHSFEYDDAIEAFRQAQKTDSGFALAFWGEALSYNQPLWRHEELARARAALAKLGPTAAARGARAPTVREKAYLDAVERLFGDGAKAARDRAYAERMGQLAQANPADDEAAVFHALALLATIPENERNAAVSLQAGAIATGILKRNPQHPGAAHYALHAFDDGEHAAMGLDAARTYARIAPASSHARHMPSHIFLPLGMWDEAVASDESSFAASVDRVKRQGLSMAQADFHSLSWLHYEYLQQGRFAKARDVMQTVERAIAASAPGTAKAVPYGAAPYSAAPYSAAPYDPSRPVPRTLTAQPTPPTSPALRAPPASHDHVESEIGRGFGPVSLKSELASMRARLVIESGAWGAMKGVGSFALGMASVRLRDARRAEAALEHLGTASKTVPDRDAREIAQIMGAELDGLLRLSRGDRAGALAALARATALEAKRPRPVARPYPIKPAAELYAETLFGAGDPAAAVVQFQAALMRTPRRAASLLGLARAAQKTGHRAESAEAAKDFLAAWHLADTDRPELAEARALAR